MSQLSVVIPVWGERYVATLSRAVASVRAQSADVPVVVVDNASDAEVPASGGASIVRAHQRLSAGAARNLGLEQVATDGVVFLDADDELAPGALAAMEAGLSGDPESPVYVLAVVEADGARHAFPHRFALMLARAPRLFALATAVWSLYPVHGPAAVRTSAARDAGGNADSTGGEDWALAVSLAFRGRVAIDGRPGLVYHRRPDSLLPRTRGTADILAAAGRVRARLRRDPAVPAAVRAALPAIALAQWTLILAIRPPYRAIRSLVAAIPRRRGR